MNTAAPARTVSIRSRLLRTQLVWSLALAAALVAAVLLAVREEADELLDDALQSTAQGLLVPLAGALEQFGAAAVPPLVSPPELAAPAASTLAPALSAPAPTPAPNGEQRFTWQIVDHAAGRVLARAPSAPGAALQATPSAGFADVPGWRVYGQALGSGSRMLYVAQSQAERVEVMWEIALSVLLAALPVSVLALLWMNSRVRGGLEPLQELSDKLQRYDPMQAGATLGVAAYEELRPVQAAIDALAARLAQRVARERDFSAHAAHALRTPLAGIDAQLAVALREVPDASKPRLQRVRSAAARLQHVVAALLTLFRSGAEVQRQPLTAAALVARVPAPEGLRVQAEGNGSVQADADLLTAALLNLLDNSVRQGALHAQLSTPAAGVLRLHDDGPGVSDTRRAELQAALDAQDYAGRTGLGLMLADLVARAHGGRLLLSAPASGQGFVAELHLA